MALSMILSMIRAFQHSLHVIKRVLISKITVISGVLLTITTTAAAAETAKSAAAAVANVAMNSLSIYTVAGLLVAILLSALLVKIAKDSKASRIIVGAVPDVIDSEGFFIRIKARLSLLVKTVKHSSARVSGAVLGVISTAGLLIQMKAILPAIVKLPAYVSSATWFKCMAAAILPAKVVAGIIEFAH